MRQSKKSSLFLIVLLAINLILANIPNCISDGYGEDSTSLGQFTDDYENDDTVSVAVNVINNQTLDCMELNYTDSQPNYENFTTYTEVDPGVDITITDTRITWSSMIRNVDSYVYRDYGVGEFGDFEYDFTFVLTDVEAGVAGGQGILGFIALANDFGSYVDVAGTNDWVGCLAMQNADIDDQFAFRIQQWTGGVLDFSDWGANRGIGTYYCTFDRSGTTIRLRIYSNSARTVLLETLTDGGNGDNTAYRYLHGLVSWDSATDPNDHSSGYVEYLWNKTFKGGYELDGYFTTEDYLNYTTGQGLTLLTNASIPYGTSITVQFSNDNATWVDNEGNAGSTPVLDGFYAIDLRDLNYTDSFKKYNLTTTDKMITPRLYQSRLITTEGPPGDGDFVCVPEFFNASSIEVIDGTLNDGNLASTYFVDGDWYNVSEVTGPPGIDIRVNFTDVGVGCSCFEFFQTFTGHPQHDIEVQIWNFTATSWKTIGPIFFNETANWACIGLGHNYTHFFDGGELFARFYHEGVGHVGHEFHVDRIDLSVIQEEECPPAIEVLVDYSIIFLAIGLIICLAIYFLYSKLK